jgi:3-oxoacyl-[acyl-carrier-protein] synthase-3
MSLILVTGVAIRGVCAVVPSKVLTNDEIGGVADRDYIDKLSQTVGVSERRKVGANEFGSHLAIEAGRLLLSQLNWEPSSIDLLVVATQTPDRLFPGISFMVHKNLRLPTTCTVFDLNLGCSAFTHGLWVVSTLLKNLGRRGILINVDTMSRTIRPDDYGNQVLFGDAGTATAIEIDSSSNPIHIITMSEGNGIESVSLPNSAMSAAHDKSSGFVINGPAVLGLALRTVPKLVEALLEYSNLKFSDIGTFVPHQANQFILEKLSERLQIPLDRTIIGMQKFGNTSSASIPLALCAMQDQLDQLDQRFSLLLGFGTGFSLSGVIADLSSTKFGGVHTLREN